VFVVVAVVCRVSVAVVNVVDVVTVRYRDVAASLAVHVAVIGVFGVLRRLAFVVVAVVSPM
jgi:hypothetical protein